MDRTEREDAVRQAIHSSEMEGAYVTQGFRNDAQEYIDGGITVEELMNRSWRRNNHVNKS